MGAPIRLSNKARVTHVLVVVRDGDAGGQVPMPLADFARLLFASASGIISAQPVAPFTSHAEEPKR